MPSKCPYKTGEERLVAIMGDEDTVTGFLLAGTGDNTSKKGGPNYVVVHKGTPLNEMEAGFRSLVTRSDVGIILICQHVANDIRHVIAEHTEALPCVMEIPSKDLPYDTDRDIVMQKLNRALGIK